MVGVCVPKASDAEARRPGGQGRVDRLYGGDRVLIRARRYGRAPLHLGGARVRGRVTRWGIRL
jgi:hypothetical protein